MPALDWSIRMADTCLARSPRLMERWDYTSGLVLQGIERLWRKTGAAPYLDYIQSNIDAFVQPDGSIRGYTLAEFNLDQINMGNPLFGLYARTGDERYRKALALLRRQLALQPRTTEGGFWHKVIYPYQMWLDGLYMAGPFYARYAREFQEPQGFDDVAHEIELMTRHTRDPRTGLLFHGWDETCSQPWADPQTGRSGQFWGRAIGWYAMALLEILAELPSEHAARGQIVEYFQQVMAAVTAYQDPASGLWYQVVDQGARPSNYLETSASSMFAYCAARGAHQGLLAPSYLAVAQTAFQGLLRDKVTVDSRGWLDLHDICQVAGLSGIHKDPNRDGTFAYYMREPVVDNDFKGVGAFLLAAIELEA